MKQMFDVSVFDNDERIVINGEVDGIPVAELTLKRLLANLSFARSISTDQGVVDFLDGLIAKVKRIDETEWEVLKTKIPFEIYYDEESNVDEVPADDAE